MLYLTKEVELETDWSDVMAASLPPQTTPFIGRTEELAEIQTLLANSDCRLLTLVGPGGIGKTRLALEVARQFSFPNGVHFVPFQSLSSPDFMVAAIADAVGFQFYPGGDPKQQLLAYFREKTMLLIMDNLEHLLDGVYLLVEILAAAPGVRILATSRERLNLLEEWVLDVNGLRYPTSESEAIIENYSAVELFLQHAHRVKLSLKLSDRNKPAVLRLCHVVGGMPLALELAAPWVRLLPIDDIASEIERCLDILATTARDVEPRHRNMRATFEPTWNRLSEEEQSVFKKLSVFRGGFTREAAEYVAEASLPTLSALVDKSLLRVDANGRYDIHELLRQYGQERFQTSPEESDNTQERHSTYYANFLLRRERELKSDEQLAAFEKIKIEFDNIRTAWRWMVGHAKAAEIRKCLFALWCFLEQQYYFQEGEIIFQLAAEALAQSTDDAGRETETTSRVVLGQVWARQGWFHFRFG
jgi:predicted ATPase